MIVQLRLSSYAGGQPRLEMVYDSGDEEELTIEVPGFDLRAFDADFHFKRLHLVLRSVPRAQLLLGCELVSPTPFCFNFLNGEPALQVVWITTPPSWTRIREETLAHE